MRIAQVSDLADAVHAARKQARWTQAQLAERASVSRDLVNRLERGSGRVEVQKVLDVLSALGLTVTAEPRPAGLDLAAIVSAHRGTTRT